ncbi:MAG: T9SS type A sorting domain-containing protein, partial [Bacteroidetes bacterium]|nr:T9SS type A sorting domain-containing protein [Bacteroidota bacterium]
FVQMTVHYTSTLPVDLIRFTASLLPENGSLVEWATASEVNSRSYTLSSSTDGENYYDINSQKAAGYSDSELNYEFVDRETKGSAKVVYYKLLQTDFDGASKEYGPISLVLEGPTAGLLLFPNPSSDFVNISRSSDSFNPDLLLIYSMQGELVEQFDIRSNNTIDVSNLRTGFYLFKLVNTFVNQSQIVRFSKAQ